MKLMAKSLREYLQVVETSLPELAAGSDGALRAVHGAAEGLDLQRQVRSRNSQNRIQRWLGIS